MTAGRVASNGHVNTTHGKSRAVPKDINRDTRRTDQQSRDVAQRELEQAAASLVVMVLGMLGLGQVTS